MGQLLECFTASGDGDDYFTLGAMAAEAHANGHAIESVHPTFPDLDAITGYHRFKRDTIAPYMGNLLVQNPQSKTRDN